MIYNPQIHHRRSIRLKGYDYSQSGMYYITLVVQDRLHVFGEIIYGKMELNDAGEMIHEKWQWIENQYPYIKLDETVIMPNHLHGIIIIRRVDSGIDPKTDKSKIAIMGRTRTTPTKPKPLGRLIGAFKTVSTKEFNIRFRDQYQWKSDKLWQRNYYEHIVRNEKDYERIAEYIRMNPQNWERDKNNLVKP